MKPTQSQARNRRGRMMYIVKWTECYLSSGGVESRTTLVSFAQKFATVAAAKARITAIRKFRAMTRFEIIEVQP